MSFWGQVREFARRDLLAEWRAGEVMAIVVPFGAVALMVFPLALGIDTAVISRTGPALFWVVTFLFTMQITLRHTTSDASHHRAMLALLGIDPFARLVGRSIASTILIWLFMAVMFPVMVLFYSPELPAMWFLALLPAALAGMGLAQIGTLAAEVTTGLRARTTLAPLLVAPLAVPLLVGGSQALESLVRGSGILPWVLLVTATDLALAVTAALIAHPMEDAAL